MIKCKYKGKSYYFDHVSALGLFAIVFIVPSFLAWTYGRSINYFSFSNIVFYIFGIYLIVKYSICSCETQIK